MRWTPRLWLTVGTLVFVSLILAHRFRLVSPLEQAFATLSRPLATGAAIIGHWFDNHPLLGQGSAQLRAENERLRTDIQALLVAHERLRSDVRDAAALDQIEAALGRRQLVGLHARIIGRSPDPTFRIYLVNRGTTDGVRAGAAAIVGDGILVGTVLEADATSARILALTDPHTTIAATVDNDEPTSGVVRGTYGLALMMDFLDREAKLEPGQLVVTSGLDAGIAPGLVLGRLMTIESPAGALFQTATVQPAGTADNAGFLTILTHA